MPDRTDKPMVMLPGPVPGVSEGKSAEERRISPRYPFTATASVFDTLTQTRVVGRCGDLSIGGCYIDTISPFRAGSAVRITLESGSQKFEAFATVTYALQSMGMGLAFNEIKADQQAILRKWVAELNGEGLPEHEMVTGVVAEAGTLDGIGNLRMVLNDLINLMISRRTITDKEGAELLRRMYR